jgi:hypothetical protein
MVPARAGRHLASRTARLGGPAEQAQTPGRSPQPPPASRAAAASQLRHLEQNRMIPARLCAVLCAEGSNQQSVQIGGYLRLSALRLGDAR